LMRRTALIATCVVALVAVGLLTAGADQKVELYTGSLDKVDLAAWGSGTVEQTDEEMYLDAETLRVDTKGFFEGGRVDLKDPVDVKPYVGDPAGAYVLLMVKPHKPEAPQVGVEGVVPGAEMFPGGEMGPGGEVVPGGAEAFPAEPGAWGPPAMEAAPPGEPPGGPPADAAMMEGMPPEWEMPGEPGAMGPVTPAKPPAPPPEVKQLRVLLVTDQGELDSGPVALADCSEVVEGWRRVVIPMSAFRGTKDIKSGKLEHVAVFGDLEEYFFVGQLEIGQEDQPLLADAGENKTVRANHEVTFTAKEQAAGVRANYTWDFDNIDGIQEDGYGPEAKWTFVTPGYYTVTLTVTDPANRKVPRTDQVRVKVE